VGVVVPRGLRPRHGAQLVPRAAAVASRAGLGAAAGAVAAERDFEEGF
jgi:hypothetical protein